MPFLIRLLLPFRSTLSPCPPRDPVDDTDPLGRSPSTLSVAAVATMADVPGHAADLHVCQVLLAAVQLQLQHRGLPLPGVHVQLHLGQLAVLRQQLVGQLPLRLRVGPRGERLGGPTAWYSSRMGQGWIPCSPPQSRLVVWLDQDEYCRRSFQGFPALNFLPPPPKRPPLSFQHTPLPSSAAQMLCVGRPGNGHSGS